MATRYDETFVSLQTNAIYIFNLFFCSEHEFFDDESNYTQFYTAFAALAADKLMQIKSSKYRPLPRFP